MTSAGVHLIYNYIGSILLLTHTHAPALKGRVAWGDTVAWGEGGGGVSRFTVAWGEAWHPDSSSIAPAMSAWPGALVLYY